MNPTPPTDQPKAERQLSDDEIRVAIAAHCGWTFHDVKRAPKDGGAVFEKLWLRPGVKLEDLTADDIAWREGKISPPDFLNLQAMHEAEKVLTEEQWITYAYLLSGKAASFRVDIDAVALPASVLFAVIHAPARSRALAFYATVCAKGE